MNTIPSSGKRIISDIVIAPKKEITSQLFQGPAPSIKPPVSIARKKKKKKIVLFAAVIAAFLFGVGLFQAKLEVILSPKTTTAVAEKTIILSKNPADGGLIFKTVALEDSRGGAFNATEKKSQEIRAEGNVVIFNKSKAPQVLISSTRLESPEGKIFRIPRTVVVPGARLDGGKTTPGSIEVAVSADKPGKEYNIGLSDFTIPGFKDSPKYELVFARSKTEMLGGASGEQLVVGKSDRDKASAQIILKAQKEAVNLLKDKIPQSEFLLVPSADYAVLKENVNPPVGVAVSQNNNFDFMIDGEIRGTIVPRKALEELLLKDNAAATALNVSNLRITNLDDLKIALIGYKFDAETFTIKISGQMEIEAAIDNELIKNFIVKNEIYDASAMFDAFPGLSRAEIKVRPFWIKPFYRSFNAIPSRIDIILQ
ncbi:hypothetical protein A2926_03730 [Candidatus Giovannonibacteria bacterium RIFCSPLOWO2_01_FULL_44_40]|uniref:Baseplate protein J-like domain-containing protein n=1 Tax=Candidatus Giovannonibacteria bacterium RIFCSPHIGHO2_01_FULL_45_23 TaxID=1798325 RepID=A0A1F5VIJ9_9BACT|nr:MAG: hypothetical protein A2834_03815 [Candidatus Giovannonibacteria bacterium RIFCSPHIGHO2_01_FULL_45_23]OGF75824.1 MAG: hypothetical protein A3C77_04555 [Candidatus Giovannonibacteria bacterium RIFCSPHIGHO2_02_FULL_45_13]OGF80245.1 MAG: hypothetical protein A2926_03730 [Candidatus Giovannonibacteria bacterium RIFCSPLOWO2_01_FULL_44_40]